ncbi:hotdog fold thioesterase [Paracoccus sp. S-4012]|uniref:PaaI family thioesterase n=1 Tax=Paracoccus sp. S-4012 TaxID=2665648 RepID=UPI0013261751|nr:hotdog fold thioesterase [Paracoccus sp. S-4012]
MDDETRNRIARQFIEAIPFAHALDLRLERAGEGEAEIVMPWSEALVGDPHSGVIHGGAVSSLLDTACGAAVLSHPSQPPTTATLDLRIDYMRGATPGQGLRAKAVCYHATRSVVFVRATAWDEDPDRPVASAAGAFTNTG